MKFKLYVLKRSNYSLRRCFQFAVVDLDKSLHYPLNFVCVLPQHICSLRKRSSKFTRIFQGRSEAVAKELLTEALQKEEDPAVKASIAKRLKRLESNK